MSLTQTFAENLKHFRESRKLSQEELADCSELDRTYISQLERALKSPTLNSIEKLAGCLGLDPWMLVRERFADFKMSCPESYVVRDDLELIFQRSPSQLLPFSAKTLTRAVDKAHSLVDDIYSLDVDIAEILGMRNLSAFIGELMVSAIASQSEGLFVKNPHQDGYPDLLFLDDAGRAEWERCSRISGQKEPFSPFSTGGIEVKATCGSVPTPKQAAKRGMLKPGLGETRINCLTGYDWKAHHRETNNLVGLVWDFVAGRPRIAAIFYSHKLGMDDWGKIVKPKAGGGRTTSVSIMGKTGIRKMYQGWVCVLEQGGYIEFLNRKNKADLISEPC